MFVGLDWAEVLKRGIADILGQACRKWFTVFRSLQGFLRTFLLIQFFFLRSKEFIARGISMGKKDICPIFPSSLI